jgi:hypothetical protein
MKFNTQDCLEVDTVIKITHVCYIQCLYREKTAISFSPKVF